MTNEQFRAKYGPWAVVTGASDGIGREFAQTLATRGLNLVLVARRESLESFAADLESTGVKARAIRADLSTTAGVQAVEDACRDLPIGLFIASAGFGTSGPFLSNDRTTELAMLDVNCRALVSLSHHFGRRFAAEGRGGMILLSSLLAFQGVPRAAHYAATKAFVQTLAEGLRHELRPLGVDVLSVAPGPVNTGFAERADMNMGMALPPSAVARRSLDALGRWTTVRPGWLSWFLELSLSTVPRFMRTRILAKIMHGFTKHQPPLPAGAQVAPKSG
ncbi:MAG: SDR family oxidoreductase [Myxococcota bacterium]